MGLVQHVRRGGDEHGVGPPLLAHIVLFDALSDVFAFTDVGKGVAVLVAEAQAERRRLQERTSEGRVEAREKGVKFGRKPSVDRALVQELRRQGLGATDIARQMHIGRSTVYTILHSGQRDEPEDAP